MRYKLVKSISLAQGKSKIPKESDSKFHVDLILSLANSFSDGICVFSRVSEYPYIRFSGLMQFVPYNVRATAQSLNRNT